MAWDSISEGWTPTTSQSPAISTSSMYLRVTSSGLSAGHHTFWLNLANKFTTAFGKTGARESGWSVTDEMRSRRYSYVSVDGPGKLRVLENWGRDVKLTTACAMSITYRLAITFNIILMNLIWNTTHVNRPYFCLTVVKLPPNRPYYTVVNPAVH